MREVVERYFAIMNELDIDALGDLFAEDIVFRLPFAPEPVPQRTEGKAPCWRSTRASRTW